MLAAAMSKPGDDIIAEAGSILLSRRTFATLPEPLEVEGDVINACLRVLQKMTLSKNIDIFPADCHTVVTWLPPMSACPFQHLPADASTSSSGTWTPQEPTPGSCLWISALPSTPSSQLCSRRSSPS
ncbi:hypothetical protein ILYODFUR_032569 [Ilyodon furcidens]|uniref:Uncharacterized protein n=1 Tax=Ilyodon furcidens TaxID=33524 RepID=A0ABV0UC86_9TELE